MKSYLDMLQHILAHGDPHKDRTGVGTTSVFGYQLRHDLREGFPLLTTKKMFLRGIVEELRWFLQGRTDNQWLVDRNVHIWDAWATEEQCAKFGRPKGDLGPIYGHQWRNFGGAYIDSYNESVRTQGVDQIANLVKDLQQNPGSRRMIVTGWNPEQATQVALPPCHTLFQCKVTEVHEVNDKLVGSDLPYLDLQLYQRSADSFLGVPFNIASYALLTHLLAHVCNLIPRYFIHTFGDLHVYNNHVDQVKLQCSRTPMVLPHLTIDNRIRGMGLHGLLDFTYEDVILAGYESHPAIKAEVAV